MADDASFTLRYHVERREISDWYWWAWRQPRGLWRYWLLFLLITLGAAGLISQLAGFSRPAALVVASFAYLAGIGFFVLFPQLKYKPSERTLRVHAGGIDTVRAGCTAHRSWRDISLVTQRKGFVVLTVAGSHPYWPGKLWLRTQTGNAFIIPDRAFADSDVKRDFCRSITAWHSSQRQRFPRWAKSAYYE